MDKLTSNNEKRDLLVARIHELLREAEDDGFLLRVCGGRPSLGYGTEIDEESAGYWKHSWC
jgi:hypothetical protein